MTSIERYVTGRIADIIMFVDCEKKFFEDHGYHRQTDVIYTRAKAHEIKMLCEYGIGDENLIEASREAYKRIVALEYELSQY